MVPPRPHPRGKKRALLTRLPLRARPSLPTRMPTVGSASIQRHRRRRAASPLDSDAPAEFGEQEYRHDGRLKSYVVYKGNKRMKFARDTDTDSAPVTRGIGCDDTFTYSSNLSASSNDELAVSDSPFIDDSSDSTTPDEGDSDEDAGSNSSSDSEGDDDSDGRPDGAAADGGHGADGAREETGDANEEAGDEAGGDETPSAGDE